MNESLTVFENIMRQRRSVRAFLPDEVSQATLNDIFTLAQTAPSNCNTQPWQACVASGAKRHALEQALTAAILRGEFSMDFPYAGKYTGIYKERQYDAANQLYSSMGIAREDKAARNEAFMRNFSFFDAPHVVFLFLDESFGIREAADVGMYAQNLMLSMAAYDVACCPQTALGFHADIVRELLNLPSTMKLLFGISFGYEDKNNAANNTRVGRADLAQTVTFYQ
jgi:nitroreductase